MILSNKFGFILETVFSYSRFNKVGIYFFANKARGGWEPQIFYSYFVMSQLYETEIP